MARSAAVTPLKSRHIARSHAVAPGSGANMSTPYRSAPHGVHAAAPVTVLYVSGGHAAHGSGPEYPAWHTQGVEFEPELASTSMLGGHLVHAALPREALYPPTPQDRHGPPAGPVAPALQMQSVRLVLARGPSEFSGHAAQAVPSPYVPLRHGTHIGGPWCRSYVCDIWTVMLELLQCAFGPWPGPHTHTVVAATGASVFDGHALQVWLVVAPIVSEYVPAAQLVHGAEPETALYLPPTHGVQYPSSAPVYPALHVQGKLPFGEKAYW